MVLCSFASISPLELGIRVDTLYYTVAKDAGVYGPGLYFTGLTGNLIKYPTSLQIMEFKDDGLADGPALSTWSNDGQLLSLDMSIFYKVDKDRIFDIFERYEWRWRGPLIRRVWGAVKTETTKHITLEYFENREIIKASLFNATNAVLKAEGFILESLQLRQVTIPDDFEKAIQDKQVAGQEILTQIATRNLTLVQADTAVLNAKADAEVEKIKAVSNLKAAVTLAQAQAYGFKQLQDQYADSFGSIAKKFTFTPKDLLKYIYYSKVKDRKSKLKLIVGFDAGIQKVDPLQKTLQNV